MITRQEAVSLSNLIDACKTDLKGLEYIRNYITLYIGPGLSNDMIENINNSISGLKGVIYNAKMILENHPLE